MQDEVIERGRPKQRNLLSNGWTKEKYDQEVKQEFFKSQELKTNKVTAKKLCCLSTVHEGVASVASSPLLP